MHVHTSTSHNNQEVTGIKMSIEVSMDKQNMYVHPMEFYSVLSREILSYSST